MKLFFFCPFFESLILEGQLSVAPLRNQLLLIVIPFFRELVFQSSFLKDNFFLSLWQAACWCLKHLLYSASSEGPGPKSRTLCWLPAVLSPCWDPSVLLIMSLSSISCCCVASFQFFPLMTLNLLVTCWLTGLQWDEQFFLPFPLSLFFSNNFPNSSIQIFLVQYKYK